MVSGQKTLRIHVERDIAHRKPYSHCFEGSERPIGRVLVERYFAVIGRQLAEVVTAPEHDIWAKQVFNMI